LLGLLLTSSDEGGAARALVEQNRQALRHIYVPEGQMDCSELDEFDCHRRDLVVATQLQIPELDLPAVREGSPSDAEQIHRVYQHVTWMRRESAEEWKERIAEQRCWVAELDGSLVAVARWSMSFGSWIEVGGVATDPDFRRRGAGTAVTLAATAAALAEGRQVVLRYSDLELASLYHPLGFEHVGRELSFHRSALP
jgi:predicted GNAT family acetyltransferase